jgi:hypothetical protein
VNRETERWLVAIVRPPLLLARFVLRPLSKLFFGGVSRHLAKKHERQLAQDIHDALPFLFTEHKGSIVLNEAVPFPPSFDYAFVTVGLGDLFLRFSRGRGELGVHVAPAFARSDWHELSLVLSAISGQGDIQRQEFCDLWDVSHALESKIRALIRFFSPRQFGDLKQRLEDEVYKPEKISIREWQTEINRRLYGR